MLIKFTLQKDFYLKQFEIEIYKSVIDLFIIYLASLRYYFNARYFKLSTIILDAHQYYFANIKVDVISNPFF